MSDTQRAPLTILTVPAFKDNYLWLVHDGVDAAVVDPGDAAPILAALERLDLRLTAILLTHHHADHTGGVPALLAHGKVPVFGPRNDNIAAVSDQLGEGDAISVPGIGLALRVIDVPGHTLGHIAYFSEQLNALFCGDTLFAGGCGRIFEGTPAQMAGSLAKLAALPDDTLVYCAHEYTLSNLRFANAVEGDSAALQARIVVDTAKRDAGQATVPSTMALEKSTNPFLRYTEPAIVASLVAAGKLQRGAAPLAAFTALREWKNNF